MRGNENYNAKLFIDLNCKVNILVESQVSEFSVVNASTYTIRWIIWLWFDSNECYGPKYCFQKIIMIEEQEISINSFGMKFA